MKKSDNKKKNKALLELRCRVEDAIVGNYLLGKPNKMISPAESARQREELREISLWGVPLLPSKGHQGTDIVLLKFLRAKDFKVLEAFEMLRRTLKWRKEYRTDEILEEELGSDLENLVFWSSVDKEGHPLCFTVYGPFKERELYKRTFGSKEKRQQFLRWRVQFMEKGIKKLSFKKGGVDSMVHITDLKNSPGPDMKELRSLSSKTLVLLQENYPELIQKNIVINAPLWYYVAHVLRSRLLSQRTKKKFVFARPSNVTKTLLKFVDPEKLPVQYGGLKREQDPEFTPEDKASRRSVKANTTACIEIPVAEGGLTLVWELTVVGWDVSYKEEFVPDDEGSYKILLQNKKRLGKIVITIENWTFKNKRVLYRSKSKLTVPVYRFLSRQTMATGARLVAT
ncbi:Sec14p-like phosphatidylinositol transfer family protein [Prunus dulcis]|uniref:Sec14p-like phosphatidylinositol transfer family protein n=1 Tax=Prunus dulcis TaxID=3755 RepID=A0A4Y1S1M4_PRUDU|nr:Sec14p-like phosphatidylinositol transfer family protein [Prunus dulcis]